MPAPSTAIEASHGGPLAGAATIAAARRILTEAFRDAGIDSPDLDATY